MRRKETEIVILNEIPQVSFLLQVLSSVFIEEEYRSLRKFEVLKKGGTSPRIFGRNAVNA